MITVSQLLGDPVTLLHKVGLYLVVASVLLFMCYEFLSFVRLLFRMWREKGGSQGRSRF
jgi:hypothetical protein